MSSHTYLVTEVRTWEIFSAGSEAEARELAKAFDPDTSDVTVEELDDDDPQPMEEKPEEELIAGLTPEQWRQDWPLT